jgi:predicted Rossmann fold nucleotide-binding protein DprA/Smf involved in DNA uptake
MPKFEMLTPAKEAELKENLWKIAKFEKAIKQEEAKLAADGQQLAQSAEDILAEMDEGLSQFRAKMKAKKAESEAILREHDAELANLASSPVVAAAAAQCDAEPAQEPAKTTGGQFKMSKFAKGRPKKDKLEEIKAC